ncbi:MAG: Rieske (2Fe-2S) protein [Deltaproteobacteria bacterium]|nr:MAG: Rieske (2Fe-2S) protein [Deltaproteobacteria bacterium]
MSREKEVYEPKPFGVDYVPQKRRLKPKHDGWVHVGYVSEIPVGKAKSVDFENVKVAVFNIEGVFYAVKDACPHAQYPLAKGGLNGKIVSCSSHNWRFDVTNGACTKAEHGTDCSQIVLRTFNTDIRGDEIWVK